MAMQPASPARARFFGPAQARPGPVTYGPGPARPGGAGRAWAAPQARGPARARPGFNSRPGSGPFLSTPLPIPPFWFTGGLVDDGPAHNAAFASPAASPNPNQPPAGRRPKPYLLEPSPPLAPTRWSSLALCRRRRSLPLALYCRPALDLSSLDSTAAARLRPPPTPVTAPPFTNLVSSLPPLLERCWG